MSGTHLFYNGVLMRDCELQEFAQVIEYDESQTDPLYSRIRITVASTLISLHSTNPVDGPPMNLSDTDASFFDRQHRSTVAIPAVDGESVVDRVQFVQKRLEQPRKDFWFALNATTNKPLIENTPDAYTPSASPAANDSYRIVLAATGIGDYAPSDKGARVVEGMLSGPRFVSTNIFRKDVIDANNGPKPQSANIVQISGGRTMRVTFTVEICRPLCSDAGAPSVHPIEGAAKVKGVISNRWGIQEALNENWETELTIEGTLIVSDHRYKPDAMRLMTTCALFPYAKLSSRHFATSEDGLRLKYRYTLKEAGQAPPPGIVDWTGKYTERAQNGGHTMGSMQVKVRGSHKLPTHIIDFDGQPIATVQRYKLYLTDWLFKIIQSRLAISTAFAQVPGSKPDQLVPVDFVVIENMKEPEVEAQITVRHSSPDLFEGFATRLHNFGKVLYDPTLPLLDDWSEQKWPIPPAYTWDTFFADKDKGSAYDGYFQSPCAEWHAKPEGWNREFEIAQREAVDTALTEVYKLEGGLDTTSTPGIPPLAPLGPLPLTNAYGWSDEHLGGGFTYIHVEIDNHYNHNPGKLVLPLSKMRTAGNGSATGYAETVAFIPIHAGIQARTFTMVATRQGAWPKVPAPKEVINNSSRGYQEHLIRAEILPNAPHVATDGRTIEYTVQVKWTYVRSKPIGIGEVIPTSADPRTKLTPSMNELPVDYFYDYSGAVEVV